MNISMSELKGSDINGDPSKFNTATIFMINQECLIVCGTNLLYFQQKTSTTLSNIPVAQHLQSGDNYKILNTSGLLELSAKDAPLINCSDPSSGSKEEKFTNQILQLSCIIKLRNDIPSCLVTYMFESHFSV